MMGSRREHRYRLKIAFDDTNPDIPGGTITCSLNGEELLCRKPLQTIDHWDEFGQLSDKTFLQVQRMAVEGNELSLGCLRWDEGNFDQLLGFIAKSILWKDALEHFPSDRPGIVAIETDSLTIPFHLLAPRGASYSLHAHRFLCYYVPPGELVRRKIAFSPPLTAVVAFGAGKDPSEGERFVCEAECYGRLLRESLGADVLIYDAREPRALGALPVDPDIFVWVGHSDPAKDRFGQELNLLTGEDLMGIGWLGAVKLALLVGCLTAVPHVLVPEDPGLAGLVERVSPPVSLVDAFLSSGARVLASQWEINQVRAFGFMRSFLSQIQRDSDLLGIWEDAEGSTPSGLVLLSSDPGDDWYL